MIIKVKTKLLFPIAFLLCFNFAHAQKVPVLKVDQLLKRIHNNSDTTYIVNFWATWCKPCVAELPDFVKIDSAYKNQKVKVILVSMDFKEDIAKKLKPFLAKHKFKTQVVLLDEINGNEFIDKISSKWSGAIPATLITKKNKTFFEFYEKKLSYETISQILNHY